MLANPGDTDQADRYVALGADDFVPRPYTADDLENAITRALARPRRSWGRLPDAEARKRLHAESVSGQPADARDPQVIEQAARADVTVLICGETGVGKELVARAIHDALAARRNGPFVKVNCAAMPHELLESELFGHERGAFTGAHQRKPGHFELGRRRHDLPRRDRRAATRPCRPSCSTCCRTASSRAWAAAQRSEVDVRVIAATNRDLAREVVAPAASARISSTA